MTIPADDVINPVEVDVRTRLREVALDRFGRHGVHETSTREIIAAAGLRNPSAINYYFGSKAGLVEDLTREVNGKQSAIIQQQVALCADGVAPTPAEWAGVAIDASVRLLATERGCLLIRVWAEHDELDPDAVELFLSGDHPLAQSWRDAVTLTFPDIPLFIAVSRNVVVLRTIQWITVRRARRLLSGGAAPWRTDPGKTRPFLEELAVNILTPATSLTAEQIREA